MIRVPERQNSRPENQTIKRGQMTEGCANKPERLRQKDIDAR
jgi:hypothetical protein